MLADTALLSLPPADAEREARRRVAAIWFGQAQDCLWLFGIRSYVSAGVHEDPARRGEVGSTITCVLRRGDTSWWVYSRNEPWPAFGLTRSGQPVALRDFADQTYVVERTGDGSLHVVGWTPAALPACR